MTLTSCVQKIARVPFPGVDQFPPALGRVLEPDGMQAHLPGALDVCVQVIDEDGLFRRAD